MLNNRKLISFNNNLMLTLAGIAALAIVFFIYASAEKDIDKNNEIRIQAHYLADELRQSSDALTRMVRSYVATSDPSYKQHYREILAIRDGEKIRPESYDHAYWELMQSDDPRPPADGRQTASLLQLMQQTGVTQAEAAKLAEAKKNSDVLTETDFAAMQLIDSARPLTGGIRAKATLMLHDSAYHRAKDNIMRPIREFNLMLSRRTLLAVSEAENKAFQLRLAFIFLGMIILFLLWRAYQSMGVTLGTSLENLHSQIERIGIGDFQSIIPVDKRVAGSIIDLLSETQLRLANFESARNQAEFHEKSRSHVLGLITSGEPLRVILEAIVRVVEQENPTMLCSILLLDDAGKHFLTGAASSLPDFYNEAIHGTEIGMGVGSCGTAAFINERVIVDDIQTHPYWEPYKELANKAKLGACWSEPIRSTKGKVLGTFAIYHHNVNHPTDADITVIEQTAGLASITIEKKQADSKLKSSENRLRLALGVTKQSWFDLNIQTGEALTSSEYFRLTGYDSVNFHSDLRGWQDSLHPDDHDAVMAAYQKCLSQGCEFSAEYRRRTKAGDWLWFNTTAEITELSSSQQPLRLIGIHTDITERKQAEQKLKRIAHYDLLTDLPNRVLLADRLSQAMVQCQRRNKSLAVAFLDLDGFKAVNDTHGHDVGDELLITVSQRMKEALREGDTLARIGGDEFIAVMVDLEKVEDSEPALERLLKATADPVSAGDAVMQVSASIGVTFYPQDGVDADQLMRHADQAMYVAKQTGKNRYHLFDTALDNAIKIQRQSISDICSALERREFVLHYQPKINMHTGEVIGVEALIRWQHPDRGLVLPLEFLPVIEGQVISLELGEWVIDTALSQISQWRSIGEHLPISVNISAHQLQQGNFTTRLAALLAAHPEVNPHRLELEILETSALRNISQVSATMNACHELGVRFALDDFGTGYSSLTYLRRLPAHLIKIDQSFVRDMLEDADDLAIIEGVVGLAKAFHREVIAEGVETIAHGEALLQLGCELAQGYGIARPMPADDIPQWVFNWKTDDSRQQRSFIEAVTELDTEPAWVCPYSSPV